MPIVPVFGRQNSLDHKFVPDCCTWPVHGDLFANYFRLSFATLLMLEQPIGVVRCEMTIWGSTLESDQTLRVGDVLQRGIQLQFDQIRLVAHTNCT